MNWNCDGQGSWMRSVTTGVLGAAVVLGSGVLGFGVLGAHGQSETSSTKPSLAPVQTFYLSNISDHVEAVELVTAVRNLLTPEAKVYFVPSQNALVLSTTPEQLLVAQKIIHDLDRPRKTYRLTYTITESDGARRLGTQHFSMVVVSGQRTTMKQGSKVPVATGTVSVGGSGVQTQFTYLDIGLNFDASLDENANGVRLRTKVEQSSIAEGPSSFGVQDPIVRQTVLEGTSIVTPDKPLVLGSLDIPTSTRHLDVGVVMEVVP